MATPIQPDPQHPPLSLDELRRKRASAADYSLPLATTVEVTDRGPRGCLFQKPNRFALDSDEQMVALSPVQAWMFATTMIGAWFGIQVTYTPFAVPGMPGQPGVQPNGPAGTPSPASPSA